MTTTRDPHRRPGWKHTMARRAIGKALSGGPVRCSICADTGHVRNENRTAENPFLFVPCECGQGEEQS